MSAFSSSPSEIISCASTNDANGDRIAYESASGNGHLPFRTVSAPSESGNPAPTRTPSTASAALEERSKSIVGMTMNGKDESNSANESKDEKQSTPSTAVAPCAASISALLASHSTQLSGFLTAQDSTHGREASFAQALKEMVSGKKTSHWVWYIFPSFLATRKTMKEEFQFANFDSAEAFLLHPTLQQRANEILVHVCRQLNSGVTAKALMGKQARYDQPKLYEFLSFAAIIAQKYVGVDSEKEGMTKLLDVCVSALKAMKVLLYEDIVNMVNASNDVYLQLALKEVQRRGV